MIKAIVYTTNTGSTAQYARMPGELVQLPVFIFQGNSQVKKLRGLYRLMMDIMVKSVGKALDKKENRTEEEDDMLDMMLHGGKRVTAQKLRALEDWAISQKGDRV